MTIKTILLSSAGGTVGRLLVQMVRDAVGADVHIIAADCAAELGHLEEVASIETLPPASSAVFLSCLDELIREHSVDAVMPFSEEECALVSAEESCGRLACLYLGIDHQNLEVIQDKIRCSETLRNAGLNVPKFEPIISREQLFNVAYQLGYPERDLVLKPISGRGSRGLRILTPDLNRNDEFMRQGGGLFTRLEDVANEIFGTDLASNLFLSEYLPGDSYSIDLVCFQGDVLGCFPHKREGYRWGFVDCARIFHDENIFDYCQKASSVLKLHGLCNIELGVDRAGELSLIEVNGRASATSAQNTLVGANLFGIFLQALNGDPQRFSWTGSARYRTYTEYSRL